MAKVYNLSDKNKAKIAPFHYKYPSANKEDIPEKYKLEPIDYRSEEIERFEMLFFHRFMRNNYNAPLEIDCQGS